jgi:hypothetical protein
MGILNDQIDSMLIPVKSEHKQEYPDKYIDHYLEQYRIYLHVFNSTNERRQKSNEFFLGINTAIMAILGYIETKGTEHTPLVFTLVPLIGVIICYVWYQTIHSYKQLNRAKFKVIHTLERKLPAKLFETEWELLGKGKDYHKYKPLSHVEKNIPCIFIVLYLIIFIANLPDGAISTLIGMF